MDNVKRFLKSSAIYFAGNVLTKIISFFLLPVYTSYIATGDMGYYDMSASYLNILVPVICMEIWSGIMRFSYDYDDLHGKHKAIFNGLVIFSGSFLLFTLLFVALGIFTDTKCLLYIYLYGLFTMLQNIYSYVARGLGYNTVFAASGIIGSLVNSVSNIIMILGFGMTLDSLYLAMIFGLATQVIIMEWKLKLIKQLSFKLFDPALTKSLIKFSLPLCLSSASYWFLSGYNRIGLYNTLGDTANGLYSVAGKFTYALTLVSICFNMAWQELAFSKGNDDENKGEFYSLASNYYIKFIALGCVLFLPFIKLIFPYFIGADYQGAFSLLPLYILATGVSIFSNFQVNIFNAEKQTTVSMIPTVISAIVNVALFHLLVNRIGAQAANVALLIGFTVNVAIRLFQLKRAIGVHIDYAFVVASLAVFAAGCYAYFKMNAVWNIVFALIVLALALFVFRDLIKKALSAVKKKFAH